MPPMYLAEELVAPGGPSAPVWAFLTTITLAVLGLLQQHMKTRSELKQIKAETEGARHEATQAHESATKAQTNTASVSNGFASRVDSKLDGIATNQNTLLQMIADIDDSLRDHLASHLTKEGNKS